MVDDRPCPEGWRGAIGGAPPLLTIHGPIADPSCRRCFGGRARGGDTKSMTSGPSRPRFAFGCCLGLPCALAPSTLSRALAPTTPATPGDTPDRALAATSAPLGLPCALAPTTLHCALAPDTPGDTPDRAPAATPSDTPDRALALPLAASTPLGSPCACTAACALALPPATSAPLGLPCALAPTTLHCATPTAAFAPLLTLASLLATPALLGLPCALVLPPFALALTIPALAADAARCLSPLAAVAP